MRGFQLVGQTNEMYNAGFFSGGKSGNFISGAIFST
jgi:hypothetical protein